MKIRKLSIRRIVPIFITFSILLANIPVQAGGWYETYYPNGSQTFNKIVCQDIQAKEVYAVGENGAYAFSKDGGFSWQGLMPTAANIYDLALTYFPDTLLIAVGQAGTVMKSIDKGISWVENNLGVENLNAVTFDGSRFWIGGDNSDVIYSSPDQGNTWESATITDGVMNVTALIPTLKGLYAAATQGNDTYILIYNDGQNAFDTVDLIPNFILKSAFENFSNLYFAGSDIGSSQAAIVIKNDQGAVYGPAMPFSLTDIGVEITSINGMFDNRERIWIATTDGFIYESDASAANFIPVYQNSDGREIRSIAVPPVGALEQVAWAGGTQGLMLKNDFGVMFMIPPPNGFAYPAENMLQIRFTSKPDLATIKRGLYIHSSIQGRISFDPSYDDVDSTIVKLQTTQGGVPGEKLTIILSNFVLEDNSTAYIKDFSYEINVIPFGPSDFSFNTPLNTQTVNGITTNFVTGFFNTDDSFDLITFARDSLICFAGDGSGGFLAPEKIALGSIITVNSAIDNQLKAIDFNHDGRLDLVLFDNMRIQNIVNTSNLNFNFVLGDYLLSNISDVEFTSVDNDSALDFIILNDSLHIRTGIDENTFGFEHSGDASNNWIKITVGDIDADGFKDIVAINSASEIILRHSTPAGGFDMEYPIMGSFLDVQLADLNADGFLDVLAQDTNDAIQIFQYIPFWNFNHQPSVNQMAPNPLHTFNVYDYNGDSFMDIVLSTTAREVKLFENISGSGFSELQERQHILTIDPTGLLHGDFDKDGFLDLAAYDKVQGDLQVLLKATAPFGPIFFDSLDVSGGQVILGWNEPGRPEEISFYRLYRGTAPGMLNFLADVDTTFFIDIAVSVGQRYWYQVEAFDQLGTSIAISNELEVYVFQELSGPISGILDDIGSAYIVTAPIEVSEGSSLQIMPGVQLVFENGADFRVYGDLQVGDPQFMDGEPNMISFRSKDDQTTWPGILISGLVNTDTVRMFWFNIENADRAFRIENRPLKIQYAGITNNNIGCDIGFSGGRLEAKNIIIFKNNIGIQAGSGGFVNLKNITLVQNFNEGLIIDNPSALKISNSIIWDNNINVDKGPDISSTTLANAEIHYSTVDSLEGNFSLSNVSRIPPIFQPIVEDTMSFIPDTLSPTIDAGDPSDDFSAEPFPNGGRINQGVYGGTPFAMPTFQPRLAVNLDSLTFASMMGQSDTKSIILQNTGTVDLRIENIEIHVTEFNHDINFPYIIRPGESATINLTFTPSSRQVFRDVILISNNDPHILKTGLPIVIEGIGLNSPPLTESSIPDTVVYTYVPFEYTIQAMDVDGDVLSFSDDSPLFNINPTNGQISFTPTINDTGKHIITININDGFITVSDTFNLSIELNQVNPALNLTVIPGDQQLTLNWLNPNNQFYSGTVIRLSTTDPITHADSGQATLDSIFFMNSSAQFTIRNLEIGRTYFLAIFNYFNPGIRIYSSAAQISVTTLAPDVKFDFTFRQLFVPPNDTLFSTLKVKNDGGGTLFCNFSYTPDVLLASWFVMDSTTKTVAPFDSTEIEFKMFPTELMSDIEHIAAVTLKTNQPGWIPRDVMIKMRILFDREAPKITMLVQPDSLHKYSALRFQFTATDSVDTLGWRIGDPTDSLRMKYRFIKLNSLTDFEILSEQSNLPIAPLDFYPLEDGLYHLDLWVYDRHGNGLAGSAKIYDRNILILASVAQLTSRRWYLASFPRNRSLDLHNFFPDSTSVIYRWDNANMKYKSYSDSTLKSGQAAWILTYKSHWLDLRNYDIDPQVDSSSVRLDKGWNQIGIPCSYPIHFNKARFLPEGGSNLLSIGEAVEQNLVAPAVFWYRSSYLLPGYEWNYIDSTVAHPWRGYWIYAPEGGTLVYSYEPVFPPAKLPSPQNDTQSDLRKLTVNDWRFSLSLRNDKHSDMGNIIGITHKNQNLPIYEPPHLFDHCALYFSSEMGKITQDLRKPFEDMSEVKEWDLYVTSSNMNEKHQMSWPAWSEETGIYMYLVDPVNERIINMSTDTSYAFQMTNKKQPFRIYATQDANFSPQMIPVTFKLLQNYPNPFNPNTTIKFGIPTAAADQKISLKVYNILGQEVATLINGPMSPGYHEVVWHGLNSESMRVASGMYFYRLKSGDFDLVRKMVLIK